MMHARHARHKVLIFLTAITTTTAAPRARADAVPGCRLSEALLRCTAADIGLGWTIGREGRVERRLLIDGGRARIEGQEGELVLSAGQRERLVSALRSADLAGLRSQAGDVDRALSLELSGRPCGRWSLMRTAWPEPASGDGAGVAAFLDGLADDLVRLGSARSPVPVPRSAEEIARVSVKLTVRPRERPGGVLIIEGGEVIVTPEEGSVPRVPRPAPWRRPLRAEERDELLRRLAAARLDELDDLVPRREAPAIGDDDGRLVTLHLMPRATLDSAAPDAERPYQPRGFRRFLADLLRAPTGPLIEYLVSMLLTPPEPAAVQGSIRDVVGRDDLVLGWRTREKGEATLRMKDLPPEERERLRQALIIAGPYLGGGTRDAERVLTVSAPVGARGREREQLLHQVGRSLAKWRTGHTARLAELLEARLGR